MSHSYTDPSAFPSEEPSPPDVERIHPQPHDPRQALPRYKVVLLGSGSYDLMHVVRTVMEVTRFCRAEATHKMWEAHHNGRSVLLTTWLERAELYVQQFAQRGLQVTVEKA